jgi:putative transposase
MAQVTRFDPVSILTGWAMSTRAFRRNRVPVEKKVVAAGLCSCGYSYRQVAALLGGMSHIAARDAYFSFLTSLPQESRRERDSVAIDGASIALNGKDFYIWLARDIDSGNIIAFQASPTGSAEDGARFLSSIGSICANKPKLRLGEGSSALRGLYNLDLYFETPRPGSLISRLGKLLLGN